MLTAIPGNDIPETAYDADAEFESSSGSDFTATSYGNDGQFAQDSPSDGEGVTDDNASTQASRSVLISSSPAAAGVAEASAQSQALVPAAVANAGPQAQVHAIRAIAEALRASVDAACAAVANVPITLQGWIRLLRQVCRRLPNGSDVVGWAFHGAGLVLWIGSLGLRLIFRLAIPLINDILPAVFFRIHHIAVHVAPPAFAMVRAVTVRLFNATVPRLRLRERGARAVAGVKRKFEDMLGHVRQHFQHEELVECEGAADHAWANQMEQGMREAKYYAELQSMRQHRENVDTATDQCTCGQPAPAMECPAHPRERTSISVGPITGVTNRNASNFTVNPWPALRRDLQTSALSGSVTTIARRSVVFGEALDTRTDVAVSNQHLGVSLVHPLPVYHNFAASPNFLQSSYLDPNAWGSGLQQPVELPPPPPPPPQQPRIITWRGVQYVFERQSKGYNDMLGLANQINYICQTYGYVDEELVRRGDARLENEMRMATTNGLFFPQITPLYSSVGDAEFAADAVWDPMDFTTDDTYMPDAEPLYPVAQARGRQIAPMRTARRRHA